MELAFYKSILDMDRASIIVCDLNHTIIYMNKTAIQKYEKRGNLLGMNLLNCHNEDSQKKIFQVVAWFKEDPSHNMVYTFHNDKQNKDVYMVALRDENGALIGYYEKHEYRNLETASPYDFSKSLI